MLPNYLKLTPSFIICDNILLSTGPAKQKAAMLDAAKLLQSKGYKLFATGGTSRHLTENGVENTLVYWPSEEGMQPQALDMLHRKEARICLSFIAYRLF